MKKLNKLSARLQRSAGLQFRQRRRRHRIHNAELRADTWHAGGQGRRTCREPRRCPPARGPAPARPSWRRSRLPRHVPGAVQIPLPKLHVRPWIQVGLRD